MHEKTWPGWSSVYNGVTCVSCVRIFERGGRQKRRLATLHRCDHQLASRARVRYRSEMRLVVGCFVVVISLFAGSAHAAAEACATAPKGMACVAAGAANDSDFSTFYVDTAAVSVDDYARCVADKSCTAPKKKSKSGFVEVDFAQAHAFCTFVGKQIGRAHV